MKPLELHIYDKHPDADAYRVGGFYSPYCLVSRDKRFQPGELGAEVYREMALEFESLAGYAYAKSGGDVMASILHEGAYDEHRRRWKIVHRFATLPHYDEADQ